MPKLIISVIDDHPIKDMYISYDRLTKAIITDLVKIAADKGICFHVCPDDNNLTVFASQAMQNALYAIAIPSVCPSV